jgi:hypothetical protein
MSLSFSFEDIGQQFRQARKELPEDGALKRRIMLEQNIILIHWYSQCFLLVLYLSYKNSWSKLQNLEMLKMLHSPNITLHENAFSTF